jgi:hypothetical protein
VEVDSSRLELYDPIAERYMAMWLFCHDDVTLDDHELHGFHAATDASDFEFVADAETVESRGAVKTKYHSILLRLDTAR